MFRYPRSRTGFTPPQPLDSMLMPPLALQRRIPVLTVAFVVNVAALCPTVRADTVSDERGMFAGVTVVGMDDGKLVFRFNDGRSLSRGVTGIHNVTLDAGADPAAGELTRAESLRKARRYAEAAALYERARTLTSHDWLRDFATFRLLEANTALSRNAQAVSNFLDLLERHPSLAADCFPKSLPAAQSDAARDILSELSQRLSRHVNQAQAQAIERLRAGLESPTAAREGPAKPADKSDAGVAGAARSKTQPRTRSTATQPARRALPRASRPTARVYQLIEAGNLADAVRAIEHGLRSAAPNDRDVWWLAEAEYQLASSRPDKAGIAAMKTIALLPDSGYYAESLFLAARAYEKLRPSKAEALYEECRTHATADEQLARLATERLKALQRADAAPSPAHREDEAPAEPRRPERTP